MFASWEALPTSPNAGPHRPYNQFWKRTALFTNAPHRKYTVSRSPVSKPVFRSPQKTGINPTSKAYSICFAAVRLCEKAMFSKLFRKCTEESHALPSCNTLQQTLEMLEEKENFLQKKITIEVERAKEFTKAKNKQAALQCLKRKKFYEGQMEHLGSFQLRIHTQEEKVLQKMPTHCAQVQRVRSNIK